jgi:hypothetical protein
VPKNARIEVPVPNSIPEIELHNKSTLVVTATYHNLGPHGPGRPEGVTFMEFRYMLFPNNSHSPGYDELTHSIYQTASPLKLSFNMSDRGKYIYCAGRWINNRGKPGDWGDIRSGIIT